MVRSLRTASVPPDSSSTLSPGRCATLLLPVLLASAKFCRGAAWGVEGIRLEAWMKSHKSEVAITYFFYLHTNQETV